jgi:hypothetical protein
MYCRAYAWVLIALGMLGLILAPAMVASASLVDDIPQGFADALGIALDPAEMLLSAAIVMASALVLAVLRMNIVGVVIVEVVVLGALTVIGWLDSWVMVMAAVVIAAMFGKRFAEWIYPQGNAD